MADIIDFQRFKRSRIQRKRFAKWIQRFGQEFSPALRIKDLPNEALWVLAVGDAEGSALLDDLIMILMKTSEFDSRRLDPPLRMRLLDLSLFFIDQLRFECMARLGWIHPMPAREIAVGDLMLLSETERRQMCRSASLREGHPHFHRFQSMLKPDRETFLRRQIPLALEEFRRRINRGP